MTRTCALVLLGILLGLAPLAATANEEEKDVRDPLVLRLLDVGALTGGRLDQFRARPPIYPLDWVSDEEWPLFGGMGEEPVLPLGTIDELIELIKGAVRPVFWEEIEGADIRSCGEYLLVVRADVEVLDEVVTFLEGLEERVGQMVETQVQAVRLTRPEVLALRAAGLSDDAVAAVLARPDRGPNLALVAIAGMQAAAFSGTQWAYLAGHDVEVSEESQIVDPLVSVANLGLIADVRALPVTGTREILVGLDVSLSRRRGHRMVDAGATGTLEVPTFAVATARSAVIVPGGAWTLVDGVGVEGATGEDGWYFLLRASLHDVPSSDAAMHVFDLPRLPTRRGEVRWDELEIRYYPVRVLAATVSHVRGGGSNLTPSGYTPPEPNELAEPMPIFPPEALVDLIRDASGEDVWGDPCSIEYRNGTLIVRQTPAVLAAIETLLQAMRGDRIRSLDVTAQVVEMPAPLARALGEGGMTLGEAQVRRLVEATESGEAQHVAVAQTTSLAEARNAVTAGRVVRYVYDYDAYVAQDAGILQPRTAFFLEGVELDVLPRFSLDRRRADVQLAFLTTHLQGPMRTWNTEKGGTIELPELGMQRLRTHVVIAVGQTSIVGSWGEGDRRRVLLLTPNAN